VSGPGGVVFGNASSAQTTATFSTYGTYVLRLSADDTELTSSDDVQITVNEDSSPVDSYPKIVWLDFDGKDDVVQVSDSASLDLASQMTVEAWIRAESVPSTGGQSRVVSKSVYELTVHSSDSGCISGTQGDVQWRAVIGNEDRRICGGLITPGMWHHVAGTYDGSRFILYVDG
jgi:hypothetical protein